MTAHQKPGTPEGGLKVALNPIQWFASPDGFHDRSKGPGLEEVWRLIKEAGFGAVPAAIPTGVELETFKTLLDRLGLAAAPGYFAVPSPEQRVSAGEMLEDARIAAGRQAALGLQNMYIAIGMPPPDSVRLARPAVGAASIS
jgi:inosose dehydratase